MATLKPDRANAHNNLGCAPGRDLGQHEAAEASFREAVRLDPDHAMAVGSLAHLLVSQKRFAELAEVFRSRRSGFGRKTSISG